jgi:hypothetical protein
MIPVVPIVCPRCNLKLKKTVGTSNGCTEYILVCPEPRCINLTYSLEFRFFGMTYFLAKEGSSTIVSLVPYDVNDSYSNLRLDVGIGRDTIFSVVIPTFNPLDISNIQQIVNTYMVFS